VKRMTYPDLVPITVGLTTLFIMISIYAMRARCEIAALPGSYSHILMHTVCAGHTFDEGISIHRIP